MANRSASARSVSTLARGHPGAPCPDRGFYAGRTRLSDPPRDFSDLSELAVAKIDDAARTQNGHIRNDTRDVSRRISGVPTRPICRRNCVANDRAMVRRGSTVRVRQRALQNPCKSADLCSGRLADSASCGGYGAVYGAFKLKTPPTAASELVLTWGAPRSKVSRSLIHAGGDLRRPTRGETMAEPPSRSSRPPGEPLSATA